MSKRSGSRPLITGGFAAVMLLVLSGCAQHKQTMVFVPPPMPPVQLAKVDSGDPPVLEVDEDEDDDLPPVPVAEGQMPKRQRKRPAKVVVPAPAPDPAPPVQEAAVTPAESASVIGEFTPGGGQDPKANRDAADLIASNDKRLNALPAETTKSQAALVSNVRNFQKQAQQALQAGDAEGAKTLATKGKLLLDDVEKAAAP